nr:transposon TX1 uncharacterized [Tanacetum cinerariifolium]
MEARRLWVNKENGYVSMLWQKAMVKWDAEGDENTKFFHSYIKTRNNKNNIRGLMINDDATELEMEFTVIEELLNEDLVAAVKWFWDTMEISRGCNSSFMTIILKVTDPIGLGDFHPISLVGCYYKIIAKLLAKKIKKVVSKVVGDVQKSFIKSRFIFDGVFIANETVGFMKKNREKCLIFKVESCLRSSTMSVLVNESPTEEFSLERRENGGGGSRGRVELSGLGSFKVFMIIMGDRGCEGCGEGVVWLYHLDRTKKGRVTDKGKWESNVRRWEWDWGLLTLEASRWPDFKVKEAPKTVEEKILRVENGIQETVWNKWVTKKVNVCIWRVLKGRLSVREELDKRGVDLDSPLCPSCDSVVESCSYCLVTCDLAMNVWNKIFRWWKFVRISVALVLLRGGLVSPAGSPDVK